MFAAGVVPLPMSMQNSLAQYLATKFRRDLSSAMMTTHSMHKRPGRTVLLLLLNLLQQ
jgi:hypothetical protein